MNMFDRVKQSDKKFDPYDALPAIVFMAFTIEAYLNSLGARKVGIWSHLEKCPWKTKVNVLYEVVGRKADWGSPPLQFARDVFKMRDALAHGKSETVCGPVVDDRETAAAMLHVQYLKPTVLKGLDRDWMIRSGNQLYELLAQLGALFGLDDKDFSRFSWHYTKRIEAD